MGNGGFAHVVEATETRPGPGAGPGGNHSGSSRAAAARRWALKLMPAPPGSCSSLGDVNGVPELVREARIHSYMSSEPSVLPCAEAFKASFADPGTGRETYMAVLKMPMAECNAMEWLLGGEGLPASMKVGVGACGASGRREGGGRTGHGGAAKSRL